MHSTIRALVLILLVLVLAGAAAGGEMRKTNGMRKADPGPYPSAPKGRVCDQPGANFYPDYQPRQYPPYGKVTAAPAYAWGYFGARSQPFTVNHSGYYRDRSQTVFPRGF
jgi:hypothetical protein